MSRPRAWYRPLVGSLLAVGVLAATGGCGSADNGMASKSPAEILAASVAAAGAAGSVHVSSQSSEGTVSASLNLELASNGGTARVSLKGTTFDVVRIGDAVYLKTTPRLYRRLGVAAPVPPGAWLMYSRSRRRGLLSTFTELAPEVNNLLRSSGRLTKGPTTTVEGHSVIELTETTPIYSTSLYIATTGKPYPVQTITHGRITGRTVFSAWNSSVAPSAPANAIDLSQLEHAG